LPLSLFHFNSSEQTQARVKVFHVHLQLAKQSNFPQKISYYHAVTNADEDNVSRFASNQIQIMSLYHPIIITTLLKSTKDSIQTMKPHS